MRVKMSNIKTIFLILPAAAFFFFLANCGRSEEKQGGMEEDLLRRASAFFRPMPGHAFTDGEEASQELIDLGKMLYYEPRLSRSGLISCHTCHNLGIAGVDNLPVSLGHKWQKGRRNAPTVLNAALHSFQFHDGREPDVESQALMPIIDAVEMAASEEHALEVLHSIPLYVELFHTAFPGNEDPVNFRNVGIAIGAFERILLTYSRFDSFIKGDLNALSTDELAGLQTFMDAGCISCHVRETLGGLTFARFITPLERSGRVDQDPGRFEVTEREEDRHFFKVPSLLNVTLTAPYFHDGSEWSLHAAIREVALSQLDLSLSGTQVDELVNFMHALSGEVSVYAREMPVLPPSTSATPLPVFD
jgi:cytochrome c peroxidase